MKLALRPEELIDREAERELFQTIMKFEDSARVLTITAKGGHGKSALLMRLEYETEWVLNAPVALIPLDQLPNPSPIGWVEFTRDRLGQHRPFPRFDDCMRARAQRSDRLFGRDPGGGGISGNLNAQQATLGGNMNVYAGVNAPIQTAGVVNIASRPDWSGLQESQAAKECMQAFTEDLIALAQDQPVVLVLDAWERCSKSIADWLTREFMKSHFLDAKRRAAKLVFVIAGRWVPPFRDMFGKDLVRSISSLGEWNEGHVRDFLEVHGYTQIVPGDVKILCSKLKEGWSLQAALTLAELLEKENSRPSDTAG